MENNQVPIVPNVPVQIASPLQNPQPDPKTPEGVVLSQVTQTNTPALSTETKSVKKKHSWISYVLIVLSVIQGVSSFFGQIGILQILGGVYYLITAFALFKKPVIGYIMFGVAILLFVSVLIIYRYTSSF